MRIRVKICGITRAEDLKYVDPLADYIGFIVDPNIKSPRRIDKDRCRILIKNVTNSKPVAVIISREGLDIAHELGIPIVQYHNTRDIENILDICKSYNIRIAPVVIYRGSESECIQYLEYLIKNLEDYEYVLLDADKNFNKVEEFNLKIPLRLLYKCLRYCSKLGVAGGINIENVRIILKFRPYLVDVSSGVEISPGVKSIEKVRTLIEEVRNCEKVIY